MRTTVHVEILPWQFPKMANLENISITIILQVIASQFNRFTETLPNLHSFLYQVSLEEPIHL